MIVGLALSAFLFGAAPAEASPLLLAQAGEAPARAMPSAGTQPARRRPPRRRAVRRQPAPPVAEAPPPAPPPVPQAEIAPMPNRSIEGPRPPAERQVTRLRPDLIEPRSLPDSRRQSGGNSSYTERQDRLYRDPAAGARLEIPFSY
ncbi:hypothetical protein [Muricoccus vinaceus]|uniref:Uncharacterized protein n=1 Tax=Muricoccus vinaceus TaxID=424704 RepID=A0ABV6IKQ9_9PROT